MIKISHNNYFLSNTDLFGKNLSVNVNKVVFIINNNNNNKQRKNMNNFKKIGLSALAGSLAAVSVNAAELSVSGGAAMYVGTTNDNLTGYYSMGDSVTFAGSGTTDGGIDIAVSFELDGNDANNAGTNNVMDNRSITIGTEAMGTVTFSGHGGSSVVGGWDDKTPNAYEEVWDLTAEADDAVIDGASGDMLLRYDSPSFSGVVVSASYQDSATIGTYSDYGINIQPEAVDGLELAYAHGTIEDSASTEADHSTMYAKYAFASITVGYQTSEIDGSTADLTDESTGMGITYAITDDFTVGYGTHDIDFGDQALDQESTGFSASYTMGGMSISGHMNETDNVGGSSAVADDKKAYELELSFAF